MPPSLATKAKKWVAEEVIELEGCFQARDLCNEPANLLNSTSYLKKIRSWGKSYGYKVSVLNKPKLSKLKMNGILAVNQGSNNPPYLVIGEYKPQKAKSHILLVGKGVTFDSGGISLKPSAGMGEMKMDMGGSAAVIGAMNNVARLKLPVRVTSLMPLVENMPSASAQRPGDVITMYNGLTVEVDNTDAEGRLILADAFELRD